MKKLCYILFMAITWCSCYEDKGNYNYRDLADVEVALPDEAYCLSFGESLKITPTINTVIPEVDLRYDWEFLTDTLDTWWNQYISVFQERDLDYVCTMGRIFPTEGSYKLRLNVTQVSSGRHFYSNEVDVKLIAQASVLGAMVLHGDGNASDIGIVAAKEFQLAPPSGTFVEQILPCYYSEQNGGAKIDGKGISIIQTYLSQDYMDNVVIIALTDESSAVTESKTMLKIDEWNDLFVGNLNRGIPQGFCVKDYNVYVFDDGDIFTRQAYTYPFTTPVYEQDVYGYDFYPQIFFPSGSLLNNTGMFFEKNKRAFMILQNLFNFDNWTIMNADSGVFNPGDMKADFVYMDAGGRYGMLAVMKEDNGNYFIAEMDWNAASYDQVPVYRYDLMHLPEVQNGDVVNWAFGTAQINMAYYATANEVKQFSVDAGQKIIPETLKMTNNDPIIFEGEITMMKILKPAILTDYYMSNVEMVIGTYGGTIGSGKLYSLELDPTSGRAKSVKSYSGFDRIYDVVLKVY